MYTFTDFKTKKELQEAVRAHIEDGGPAVRYYQPNDVMNRGVPMNDTFVIEGPHYPKPHKWYAECTARDGVIVKVR
jgi:hypothetical protein